MNTGTTIGKKMMKTSAFWKLISKDSRKHLLGVYEEYMRQQERKKKSNKSEDEE